MFDGSEITPSRGFSSKRKFVGGSGAPPPKAIPEASSDDVHDFELDLDGDTTSSSNRSKRPQCESHAVQEHIDPAKNGRSSRANNNGDGEEEGAAVHDGVSNKRALVISGKTGDPTPLDASY